MLRERVFPFMNCRLIGNIYRTASEGNAPALIQWDRGVTAFIRTNDEGLIIPKIRTVSNAGLRLGLALEIERHCSADEILQGRLIDLLVFVDIDGAPDIPVEAGVE